MRGQALRLARWMIFSISCKKRERSFGVNTGLLPGIPPASRSSDIRLRMAKAMPILSSEKSLPLLAMTCAPSCERVMPGARLR